MAHSARTGRKHSDENKALYRKTCELGLIIALSLAVIVFIGFQKKNTRKKKTEIRAQDYVVVMVDDIPVTTFDGSPRPPDVPSVPLPSEDLFMPSDDVLDTTVVEMTDNTSYLDYELDDALFDDEFDISAVLPQGLAGGFVELEIQINYQGWVDSVIVVQNTTGERAFADLARKTAFRTRYVDERPEREHARWIKRYFNFRKK